MFRTLECWKIALCTNLDKAETAEKMRKKDNTKAKPAPLHEWFHGKQPHFHRTVLRSYVSGGMI